MHLLSRFAADKARFDTSDIWIRSWQSHFG
jgi:hypothetical protein